MAEIPHEQYGSTIFVRSDYICDSASTSTKNNVEIIQAQLNNVYVNQQMSGLRSPRMNVVIGDINSHSVDWRYIFYRQNGTLVEKWSASNQPSLVIYQ